MKFIIAIRRLHFERECRTRQRFRRHRNFIMLGYFTLLLCLSPEIIYGFKILGICPSTSYSHQQPFQALMKALAERDHQVTVISPIPLKVSQFVFLKLNISRSATANALTCHLSRARISERRDDN